MAVGATLSLYYSLWTECAFLSFEERFFKLLMLEALFLFLLPSLTTLVQSIVEEVRAASSLWVRIARYRLHILVQMFSLVLRLEFCIGIVKIFITLLIAHKFSIYLITGTE